MKYGCSDGQHPKGKAISSRVRVQEKIIVAPVNTVWKKSSHLTKHIVHAPQSKLLDTSDREIVSYTRALR